MVLSCHPSAMNEHSNMEALKAHEWSLFPVKPALERQTASSQDLSAPGYLNQAADTPSTLNFLMQLYRACEGNFTGELRKQLVEIFCSKLIDLCSTAEANMKEPILKLSDFACPTCFGKVREPLTMSCGHTYCKKCVINEVQGTQCKLCPVKFITAQMGNTRPNVVLMDLVDKFWPNASIAASLRNEGNELCSAKKHKAAVQKYTEAIELCPTDHLSLSNRSHALFILGNSEDALSDAEASIKASPYWFKGYFRKAVALSSLGRFADSFSNLALCVYMMKATKSDTVSALKPVKTEMARILNKLFPSNPSGGHAVRRHTLDQSLFSPYPSQRKIGLGRRESRHKGGNSALNEPECYSSGDEGEPKDNISGGMHSRMTNLFNTKRMTVSTIVDQDQHLLKMHRLFSHAMQDVTTVENRLKTLPKSLDMIDKALVSSTDFECSLCYRLFYQPVTTPCGHTYCKSCLERSLDHAVTCPLCKTEIQTIGFHRNAITELLNNVILKNFPVEHEERAQQHMEEIQGTTEEELPIFVCTMAFPSIPCPLHIFEPRYRLMLRRCMDSRSKEFGMCCYVHDADRNYGEFGTVLKVTGIQYFPDGRSVVETVGVKRFRVIEKHMRDGYNTATVEYLTDTEVSDYEAKRKLQMAHEKVYNAANEWLRDIKPALRNRIFTHFGPMPSRDEGWSRIAQEGPQWTWWLLAILPLDPKAQLAILSMNNLQRRLDSILKVLKHLHKVTKREMSASSTN